MAEVRIRNNKYKGIKLIILAFMIIVFAICAINITGNKTKKDYSADYDKVDSISAAMSKLVKEDYSSSFADVEEWVYFSLEDAMSDDSNEFYKKLTTELGADFNYRLSNGKVFYIGLNVTNDSYRIYAEDTNTASMLYPTWAYKSIPAKE